MSVDSDDGGDADEMPMEFSTPRRSFAPRFPPSPEQSARVWYSVRDVEGHCGGGCRCPDGLRLLAAACCELLLLHLRLLLLPTATAAAHCDLLLLL